jgi:5'(3')-deoxyribonucleotidase
MGVDVNAYVQRTYAFAHWCFFFLFLVRNIIVKISLDTLANVHADNTRSFCEMNRITPKEIEKYVGGQCSKISRLRANLYKAQEMGKIEKEEIIEIERFCNENLQKCEEIARNFDLFRNVGVPKNTYANFNHRVNSLLKE